MNTERMLQTCIALMAALATLMLGLSQDDVSLAVIALVAATISLVFCDFLGWFHLHPFVAGVAGLAAGLYAFVQSQSGGLETQFISVANLLIHLQVILLFQRKTTRIYWQLITLSLLQVVVAAALNLFFLFGPLLVVYSGFALAALLFFFIYRETLPFLPKPTDARASRSSALGVLNAESRAEENTGAQAGKAASKFILIEPHNTEFATKLSERRPRRELLTLSFVRHFFMLTINTVVVAACMFLLMPRYGDGVWRSKMGPSKTGFSGEVDLESSGSIYESPTIVMRVSFTSEGSGTPYLLSSEPYFRGSVLTDYERGKWRRKRGRDLEFDDMQVLPEPQRIYSAVRQKVVMERQRGGVVFGVDPVCRLEGTPAGIRISADTQEAIYEPDSKVDDPAEYAIGSFAFRNGLQSQFTPIRVPYQELLDYTQRRWEQREELPELKAVADTLVADIPAKAVLNRVRALEAHFTRGGYQYSLDPSPERNPDAQDLVVDFVTNHKTGHCQYFASALALMLRSQGIPARVVVGYRADTFNVVGNYYQLREMDAHAWVEAAIPADQVPADEIMPTEGMETFYDQQDDRPDEPALRQGAWVRLDPTPGGDWVSNSVAVSPWRQKMSDSMDYMQLLWSEYVLGLNEKRQRKAIYEPIKNFFKNAHTLLLSKASWSARWEMLRDRFQGDFFSPENGRDTVIAVAVLTVAFYVLKFIFRLLRRLLAAWWKAGRKKQGPRIEFYRRFETLLAKHGIRREDRQTQREFALAAADQLHAKGSETSVTAIPAQVVDLFYRVRFGQDRLDSSEVQRLENWLEQLQTSLAGNRK